MSAPRLLAPTTISGGIPTAGAGTLNTVALWTPDGFTLGNSLLTQAGSIITNATGAIRANGTTQTTPAFTRHDTTTSGIYFPATNEIGFTISSQHAMFISSGRNVGIGTASPGSILDVLRTQNSTTNAQVRNLSTGAAAQARMDIVSDASTLLLGVVSSGWTTFGLADGDAYISNNSARIIQFGTGGSERMRISGTASQVAIGTSSFTTGRALTTVADLDVFGVRVGRGAGSVSSNTVVGNAALNANTSGTSNTAVGNFAANAVTTGAQNTSIGFQANALLQGGSRNTAVGESAGYAAVASTDNTAVGRYAAVYNTGNNNVAVGSAALNGSLGSSTGGNNVAVGMQSGQSITTGTNNVFVGYVAGSGVTTSTSNTMIGYATASGGTCTGGDNTLVGAIAGNQITTGANNVCIGSNAGQSQTTASDNAYVGKNAGYYQTGGANTAVGRSAMTGSPGVSNGQANAALGNSSLSAITSGSYNVCAGFNAGNNITTGSSNIVLGTDAQTAAATDSNQLVLGSSTRFVATNGGATTYYATAGASLGYIQVRLNGANVKIQVFAP